MLGIELTRMLACTLLLRANAQMRRAFAKGEGSHSMSAREGAFDRSHWEHGQCAVAENPAPVTKKREPVVPALAAAHTITVNTMQIFGTIDPAKISDYTDYRRRRTSTTASPM